MGYRLDVSAETVGKIRKALQDVVDLTKSIDSHEKKRFLKQIERSTENIYQAIGLYDKGGKPKLKVPLPSTRQAPKRKLEEIPDEVATALDSTAPDGGPTSIEMEG